MDQSKKNKLNVNKSNKKKITKEKINYLKDLEKLIVKDQVVQEVVHFHQKLQKKDQLNHFDQ